MRARSRSNRTATRNTRRSKPFVASEDALAGVNRSDGYEVARRIPATDGTDDIPLMAITGYGRDEDRELAREAGLADYLMKPVDFEKLRRTLAELLRAREATGTVAPE